MLGIARYHFRATLGARWRSFLGGIVLFALLGGVSVAAVSGARRTASAYQRFLDASKAPTMVFNAGNYSAERDEMVRRLPLVADTATYVGFNAIPLDNKGRPLEDLPDAEALGSVDGRFFRLDRTAVVNGRLPDPNRADEAAVNESLFKDARGKLGQRLSLGVFTDEQIESDDFDPEHPPEPVTRSTVTVVGVIAFGDEVVQGDAERLGRILLTPAFTKPALSAASYAWQAILLKHGDRDIDTVQAQIRASLPPDASALFRVTSSDVGRVQRALRPMALALGVFGLLVGLAAIVLFGQAILRALRAEAIDATTLRAVGASPRSLVATVAIGPLLMVILGTLSAGVVALALSPLAPLGASRRIEVHPGIAADWTVLAGGLLVATVLIAGTLIAAAGQGRGQAREAGSSSWRRSRVAMAAGNSGLPVSMVAGTRMALEGGPRGNRASVPTRSTITGSVIAVIALASTLCFSASLRTLVNHPRLYGWDWDIALNDNVGYGHIDMEKASAVLDSDRDVKAWAPIAFSGIPLDGSDTAAIGVDPAKSLTPPLLTGRRVLAPDEVVLGPTTLAHLGKHIGDEVRLGPEGAGKKLRIVGTASFPSVGPLRGSLTSLGTGAMVADEVLATSDDSGEEIGGGAVNTLFLRLRPGSDHEAVGARLLEALGDATLYPGSMVVQGVQRPAEIVNSTSMGLAPAVLAGIVATAVLLSLALALLTSVRRRRRELALLKVLGFTGGQLRRAVVSQSTVIAASGLLMGLPVGIALGRWLWVLFARQLSVVASPTLPVGLLLLLAGTVVVLSNLVALAPAAMASRTTTADVLRKD